MNQILEALKFKSNDIQISHPTNFLVQNNIENTTEKINSQPFTGKNPNFEVSHLYPEILKDHKQEIKFSECDPSFLEIVGMKPSLKFEEKNLEVFYKFKLLFFRYQLGGK